MQLKGTAVSGGYAVGEAYLYDPYVPVVKETLIKEYEAEAAISAFKKARLKANEELEGMIERLKARDEGKAQIFAAHTRLLFDVAIEEEILELISEEQYSPGWAIKAAFDKYMRIIKKGRNKIIGERADDLKDVCTRLLRCLEGIPEAKLDDLDKPVILVAHDLVPSDTADLDREKVLAILTEVGGPTSHCAIIAKSYGIPAILGIPGLMDEVGGGALLAVDACSGTVELDPDERCVAENKRLAEEFRAEKERTDKFKTLECRTADGVPIDICINIANGTDEELAAAKFVDGIGLFRTEFLFMGRDQLPGEDEQYEIYKKVLAAYAGKPVTLRTLDIGGDKQTACIDQPHEENPFLGRRALRLCFDMPQLFKTQIRAALRASVYGELWIMLPMVGSMEEIYLAKKYIKEAEDELKQRSLPFNENYKLGIMIEIPSIALISDMAAREVDFASIGSNDLCQYTLAVDRMSPLVSKYYQPFNPAMLRLIGYTVEQFCAAGKTISICGEMGGDPCAAAILIGLGMRKLSMGISSVARVKEMISKITVSQAEKTAARALQAKTAAEAENLAKQVTEGREN